MPGLSSASRKSLPTIARYFLCSFLSNGPRAVLETLLAPVGGDGFDFCTPYIFSMSFTYAVVIDTSILSPWCLNVRIT